MRKKKKLCAGERDDSRLKKKTQHRTNILAINQRATYFLVCPKLTGVISIDRQIDR